MGRGQKRQWGGGGRGFGGGGGRGRGRGGRGGGGGDYDPNKRPKSDYIGRDEMSNEAFEDYYRTQGVVPEGEWGPFLDTLRRPLPVTFRINGSGKYSDHLRDKLAQDFFARFSDKTLMVDGEPVQPPQALPWYPNNYAWKLEFSRGQLRKMPLLEQIHEFVKRANDAGSISRQEAVSMVPPLFLDVLPEHRVLDMCAAPGSKTAQLLEMLHAGCRAGESPPGFVVANDVDFKRCNLLTHQTKRVCSPSLVVTNHSAERFPLIRCPKGGAGSGYSELQFDRVLCDVPCSGDGTMRKAPDIWRRWNVNGGNGLHPMQLKIAMQGCRLLKVGGRIVYSTCTFNPIEDEAVVAEVLVRCKGAMQLVDVADHLPALRRMPGMTRWKVKDRFRWYSTWEEAREIGYKLDPTMFPTDEKAALPMERCMRFLPHHADTGGFFVAVLEKVAVLPDEDEVFRQMAAQARQGGGGGGGGGVRQQGGFGGSRAADEPAAEETAEQLAQAPLEVARAAAAAAAAAAEAALAALDSGSAEAASKAAEEAEAAARHAAAALERHTRGETGRPPAAAANCDADNDDEGMADAAAKAEDDGDAEAAAAAAEDGDGDAAMEAEGEAAGGAEGEAGAEGAGAGGAGPSGGSGAAAASAKPVEPSWIRGGGGRGRTGGGGQHQFIDPVIPLEDQAILSVLQDYYGLGGSDFPLSRQLITRSADRRPKRLYYISASVLELLLMDEQEQLKIIATGLKVFERQEMRDQVNECPYRLAQEGLPLVLPHISRQRLTFPAPLLLSLLRERFIMLPQQQQEAAAAAEGEEAQTTAAGNPKGRKPVLRDAAVLATLEPLKLGCVVVELDPQDATRMGFAVGGHKHAKDASAPAAAAEQQQGEAGAQAQAQEEEATGGLAANAPMAVVAWKGRNSVSVMVEKAECSQMIDKLDEELKKLQEGVAAAAEGAQ